MTRRKRLTIDERIAQLEAKSAALRARKVKSERTIDTRRKVLLGAFVIHLVEAKTADGEKLASILRNGLAGFLKQNDRALLASFCGGGPAGAPADQSFVKAVEPEAAAEERPPSFMSLGGLRGDA